MINFVLVRKPKSYNSWNSSSKMSKESYKVAIRAALNANTTNILQVSGELYGLVYHFYKIDIGIDADNLSKPIWDCLRGIAFSDDNQVKFRVAGNFNFMENDFDILDLTKISGELAANLLTALDENDHVLYIEVGKLNYNFFRFNLETYGN